MDTLALIHPNFPTGHPLAPNSGTGDVHFPEGRALGNGRPIFPDKIVGKPFKYGNPDNNQPHIHLI